MREVAKAAGVSIKTVSNVVNDYELSPMPPKEGARPSTSSVMSSTCPRATCVAAAPASSRSPSQTCSWSYFAQLSSLIITEAKKLGLRVIVEQRCTRAKASWTRRTVRADRDGGRPDLQPASNSVRTMRPKSRWTTWWSSSANASSPIRLTTSPPRMSKAPSAPPRTCCRRM